MGWYRVCLNTIVRKEVKLDSERLRILPMGSRVNVVKKEGRRVMIDQPIKGWCSLSSSNGDTILKPLSEDSAQQTPRSNPEAQAAHYKAEANNLLEQAKNAKEEEEKEQLKTKAAKYDALSKQVLAQQQAHEQELATLAKAATSTNVQNMVFRDGDVVQLVKKNHDGGIVIVRTTVEIQGKEFIGADYAADAIPHSPSEGGTHPATGDTVHFTSADDMRGGWVNRDDVVGYLPGGSIIPQLNSQVLENQLLTSTLDALKSIIKELDAEKQWNGIATAVFTRAKQYQMQE